MIVIPPFVVFLVGAPVVLLARGMARRVGLVVLAGLALVLTLLLPEGAGWTVPFMEYSLVLFRSDALSLFTGYIFAIITFLATLYAAAFARPWLHLYALLYAGTSLGAAFAGDVVSLLIFWEAMAITSTLLVWEHGGAAIGAGFRYLMFHALGGALLAGGLALYVFETGTVLLGPVGGLWPSLLTVLGIGVNVGFIPLHTWLPDTYPRPHIAASVFLSIYTTKAGVYVLARLSPGVEAIAIMGGVMAVYGVTFALLQNDMRKLLSYHIVSQVGYMVAGVGLGTAEGINAGMAHVFNHILYKALLFMAVGAVIHATGQHVMDRLGGLARRMPVTAATFWIAAFSISGVPGFNGYVSKGMVITASEGLLPLRILLEIASFGTFLSFLKLGYFVFHRKGAVPAKDPPWSMQAAQVGTAVLCIAIGLYPALLLRILPYPTAYNPWTPGHLLEAGLVLVGAGAVFFTVGRTVLAPHETRFRDADVVYAAAGRGLVAFSRSVATSFATVYDRFVAGVSRAGSSSRRLQTGDLNWNVAGVVLGILLVLLWLLWEVAG